jgi:hypothetical protein
MGSLALGKHFDAQSPIDFTEDNRVNPYATIQYGVSAHTETVCFKVPAS